MTFFYFENRPISHTGERLSLGQISDEFEQSENVNDFQQVPIFRFHTFSSFQKSLLQIIFVAITKKGFHKISFSLRSVVCLHFSVTCVTKSLPDKLLNWKVNKVAVLQLIWLYSLVKT